MIDPYSIRVKITDSDALEAIPPEKLKSYLLKNGWVEIFEYEDKYKEFGRSDSPLYILCPLEVKSRYAYRIAEGLTDLSIYEDRSQLAIYRDIMEMEAEKDGE